MPGAEQRRVLFVTRKWRPAVGGMENYCHELTEELRGEAALSVRALPGRADGRPPSAPALFLFGLRTAAHLARHARRYDVVHFGDLALWPLALVAQLTSPTRLVASAHGTDIAYGGRSGVLPTLYDVYLKVATLLVPRLAVIANSRATAALCRRAGFHVGAVVPLGVTPPARSDAVQAPSPYVLFVGRLVRRKGCGWFIRNVLPRLDRRLRLVIAGVEWDASETEALRTARVEFLGPVFGAELRRLRREAVAVVMPNVTSRDGEFEGFGLTALEAAADQGVLLASALDGIVDAVVDGVTGFLLPPDDAAAWADKIHEIAAWPLDRRREFVRRAVERVGRDFTWRRVALQTLAAYDDRGSAPAVESQG